MQTIAYPTALRTLLAQLDLAAETHQVSLTAATQHATDAIQAAKTVLIAQGAMDATWQDTGWGGATPIPFVDNPEGLTMIFYNGTHL